jgi:hypothetical protein
MKRQDEMRILPKAQILIVPASFFDGIPQKSSKATAKYLKNQS